MQINRNAKEIKPFENLLLNSPMIFIDVDPHNGFMEYELYEYLRKKQYRGITVCDDIRYFDAMRDNFWMTTPAQAGVVIPMNLSPTCRV